MRAPLRRLAARARALFQGSRLDRELSEELATHVELLTDENVRRGMSPDEAARAARIALGGASQLAEAHREARSLPLVETMARNVRHALRALGRDAGFTAFVILIAGLGIGASTTIWNVVQALWLRPLPIANPANLTWIEAETKNQGDRSNETLRVSVFLELRETSRAFEDLAGYFAFYEVGGAKVTGDGVPERLTSLPVSQNFFSVLGVSPRWGRTFTEEECAEDLPVVLLSEKLWARRFARDPRAIGRTIEINGRTRTILGVLPFDFGSLLAPGQNVDLFTPLPLTPEVDSMGNTLSVVGRLRPGFDLIEARAEAEVLAGPIGARHDREGLRLSIRPFEERVRGGLLPALRVLCWAVGIVLLIVCANLASLQLARAATRQRENAIRFALGGRRGQIIGQMAVESLLLAGGAMLFGLGVAAVATRALAHLDSLDFALRESIHFDSTSVAFALACAALTTLALGLAPLALVPTRALAATLRSTGRTTTVGKPQTRLRSGLVIAEIAFACALVVGAGLLLRSLYAVLDVELGFRPEQAVALRVDDRPPSGLATDAYLDEILRITRELPQVQAVGLTDVLPLAGNRSWGVGAKGEAYSPTNPPPDAFVRVVSDGYLAAMGIALEKGRDFDARDREGNQPVIVINASLARRLWPGQEALGQTVLLDSEREVVGIVSDVRHIALEKDSGNELYLPIHQTNDRASLHVVARTTVAPEKTASALHAALVPLIPNLPPNDHQILSNVVDRSVSSRRALLLLLGGFAVFALLLAALGIYGVISYSVTQRRSEIAIRMALGASAAEIRQGTLGNTLALAGLGIALGFVASLALAEAATKLLYGVSGRDPLTYAVGATVMILIAVLAGLIPAQRAARTDPITVLKGS